MELRDFQRQFIQAISADGIETGVLSLARGNGKSALAGHLIHRSLSPGDPLFLEGSESCLVASTIEQARICFRFARRSLEPNGGYRFLDSNTRIGITHTASNTKLRIIGSNAMGSFGLVHCPILIADEPACWTVTGGSLLYDSIVTAQGKPFSPLKVIFIGTVAPARDDGWWARLVAAGTQGSVYVQALQGDLDRWDCEDEIRRVNPLTEISKSFLAKLLEERDAAKSDERLKARFLSYRLNRPTRDSAEVLLTVADWEKVVARPVAPREGSPVIGIDLGAGRSWSAAVALWPSGRCEARLPWHLEFLRLRIKKKETGCLREYTERLFLLACSEWPKV